MAPRYTKRRGGIYWFQLSVPKDLRGIYGKSQVQESLRTRDARQAAAMAYERAGRWKLEFEKDRSSPSESPRDLYLDTLRRVERIKLTHADRESREAALDALWDGIVSAEVERLGYGPEHGEHNPFPDEEWSPQAGAVLDAIKNAREGNDDIPPEYREKVSETAERFIADRQRDPKANPITKQTIGQMEAVYRLFADHIKDAPLSTVSRQTVATFLDRAKTLHVHWGILAPNDASIAELRRLAEIGAGPF